MTDVSEPFLPPGSRFRRRLTDSEMMLIKEAVKKGGSSAGFDALWDILLWEGEGVSMAEAAARRIRYQVRDYAIPADQDTMIQRLLSVPPSRETRRRWSRRSTGMAFLFYGPATFDEHDGIGACGDQEEE